MNQSQVVAIQLQRRDPVAWTALLRECLGAEDIVVTAVSAEPMRHPNNGSKLTRYFLALANHHDPITIVGKQTNPQEIAFYQHIATQYAGIAPRCWFIHPPQEQDQGWILLDDVPHNLPPQKWSINDVDALIEQMVGLHSKYWCQQKSLQTLGLPTMFEDKTYTPAELRSDYSAFIDKGAGVTLSEHAIKASGNHAPQLLKAANGLAVMRALGGWPGIISETHLTIAEDLLDDPLPMLDPLRRLPTTLIHGSPHSYHWAVTLFDDIRLLDWKKTAVGPGIYDLVNFVEQFEVLYEGQDRRATRIREEWPISEETIIDNYILGISRRLGNQFNGRLHRNAIPAAHCLYTLTNWFTFFAEWANAMPNKYTWQKVNRLPSEEVVGTIYEPFVAYRPYLSGVFARFLRAYRSL